MRTPNRHKNAPQILAHSSTVQRSTPSIQWKGTAGMLKRKEGFSSYLVLECQNLVIKPNYLDGVRKHLRIFLKTQMGYIPRLTTIS